MAESSDNVWMGDLPPDMDKELLHSVFEAYGAVVDCRVLPPKQPGQNACAMVRFASLDEAKWVVDNLNGNIPTGLSEPITCRYANKPAGGGGGKGWATAAVAAAGKAPAAKGGLRPSPYGGGAVGGGAGGGGFGGGGFKKTKLCNYFQSTGNCNRGDACTFAHGEQELGMPQGEAGAGAGGGGGGGGAWAPGSKGTGAAWGAEAAWGAGPPQGGAACGKGGKPGAPGSAQGLLTSARKAGILGGGKVPVECQIYIKNLPLDMSDLDLYRLFSPFGAISSSGCKAMLNEDGSCKGFGFVDYVDEANAQLAAASLNGFVCSDGGSIHVSSKIKKQAAPVGKGAEYGAEEAL